MKQLLLWKFACFLVWYSLLWSIVICKEINQNHRKQKAKKFYDDAMKFIQENDYRSGLAYLRAAVRLDNSSALYWNDLGVTEMRLREFPKAYRRFLRAKEINPEFTLPDQNLEELKEYFKREYDPLLVQEILSSPLHKILYPHDQQHTIKEIPSFSSRENFEQFLSNLKTRKEYLKLIEKPFIIRNYISITSKLQRFLEFSRLKKRFHDMNADFYPHNMIAEQSKPVYKRFADAIDLFLEPNEAFYDIDASEKGSYLQWNLLPKDYQIILQENNISLPTIIDDSYTLQECLTPSSYHHHQQHQHPNDNLLNHFYINTHWKMLIIGEKGSGIFNHQDTLLSPTYQLLLQGIKQWHLCSNSFTSYLYSPKDEINLFAPNYHRFPKVKKIKCYQFNLTAGDFLYYPGDYHHQTMNFETPTIGLTGTFITEKSYWSLMKELSKECAGANRLFVKDIKFCEKLEFSCYFHWKELFGSRNSRNKDDDDDEEDKNNHWKKYSPFILPRKVVDPPGGLAPAAAAAEKDAEF